MVIDLILKIFGQLTDNEIAAIRREYQGHLQNDLNAIKKEEHEEEFRIHNFYRKERAEQRERMERQADIDARYYSETVEVKQNELIEFRSERWKLSNKLNSELREVHDDQIAEFKTEQKTRIDNPKKLLDELEQDLAEAKKKLEHEKNKTTNVINGGQLEKQKIQDSHDKLIANSVKTYQQDLIHLENQKSEILRKRHKVQSDLKEKLAEIQNKNEKGIYEEAEAKNANQLLNALRSEMNYEKMKDDCGTVIMLFEKFETIFDKEQIEIFCAIEEIVLGLEVTNPPNLKEMSNAVQNLINQLSLWSHPALSVLQKEFQEKLEELSKTIRNIDLKFRLYKSSRKSEDGEKKLPLQSFLEVTDLYNRVIELVLELSGSVLKFNIPPPKLFEEQLCISHETIVSDRIFSITNGSNLAIEFFDDDFDEKI